jgi:glycosyltransferase involved in cell wall biosynthesis
VPSHVQPAPECISSRSVPSPVEEGPMLGNASVICFGKDWGTDPTSSAHIMRILSRNHRVLWVNSIIRRPGVNRRDLRRLLQKFRRSFDGCVPVSPNMHVFHPLIIPFPDIPTVARVNSTLLSAALRRVSRRLRFERRIVWTFFPTAVGLLGRLRESAVIYHCVDDYAEFRGVNGPALRRAERELVKAADLVFTSSELLWRERLKENSRTYFLPHGVDVDHFGRALDPGLPVPADVQALPRPIVGYYGLIADYVDLELIAEAARRRPRWSFVLVGGCVTDLGALRGLANVHLLGPRSYESLPGYCRGFDVGVIPFRVNALTVRANPLKLREYLAAGLPVVSTPLPEVARYGALVHLADGPEAFVGEIARALEERSGTFIERRRAAMREESWESRVREMCRLIRDTLGPRLGQA